MWTVELWTGAAWVRTCAESNRENGFKALEETAAGGRGCYRLLDPKGVCRGRRGFKR